MHGRRSRQELTHRRKDVYVHALVLQGLHFAGKPSAAVSPLAPVQRADADGVPGCHEEAGLLVIQHAGKDAIQHVPQVIAVPQLLIEVADNGRVRLAVLDNLDALQGGGLDVLVVVYF